MICATMYKIQSKPWDGWLSRMTIINVFASLLSAVCYKYLPELCATQVYDEVVFAWVVLTVTSHAVLDFSMQYHSTLISGQALSY